MFFLYEKDTYLKISVKRCFKPLLKDPDVVFPKIILLTICRIFIILHVKYTHFKIYKEALFQTVIKETRCLVSENHIFNNM